MLKKLLTIIGTIAIALAIFISIYPTASKEAASISSVSGLATLHELNREAIAYEEALNNHKPTLIEFYADWCTTCQGMANTVQELHRQYGDKVNLVMLDIDSPQWRSQIARYRVTGVPQFTFLNEQQQVADTLVGNVPKTVFVNLFEQLIS